MLQSPRFAVFLSFLLSVALTAGGCTPTAPAGEDAGLNDPTTVDDDDAGPRVFDDVFTEDADRFDEAAGWVAAAVCSRLHGNCADNCDNPFVYCGDSEADCRAQYALSFVDDDHTHVNLAQAAVCAEQVLEQSCLDLDPDSVACDLALIEGCPDDADGVFNYLPELAETLTLPATLSLDLCDDVGEFYLVQVPSGHGILPSLSANSTGEITVLVSTFDVEDDGRIDDSQHDFFWVDPGETIDLDRVAPVHSDREMLVRVEATNSRTQVELTLDIVQPPVDD